ncbi:TIR domain-containing protein [Stenotrophomonas sp.]|uniref:TIR domain-containing protein n=1 Tax=Stenotrophomonas sp. TaxID=69392 RepID=UPI0031D02209
MKLRSIDEASLAWCSSLDGLCAALNINKGRLLFICYKRSFEDKYRSFDIKKKGGGSRRIESPKKGLAILQRRMAALLEECVEFKSSVKGFVRGQGIHDNAQLHKRSSWVLNVDVRDFFGSIGFARVRATLKAKPFEMGNDVATVIAQMCTINNRLPQGAPTSPILANIVASMLDNRMLRLAMKRRLSYSRYVDDLSFSAKKSFPASVAYLKDGQTFVGDELALAFASSGFEINSSKSRLQFRASRQEVTGLVANKKVNVPVEFKARLRSAIKQWIASPVEAERHYYVDIKGEAPGDFKPSLDGGRLRANIYGRLAYMSMVKGVDDPTFVGLSLRMARADPLAPKFIKSIEEGANVYDVFLCHASEDKEKIVVPLCEALQELGMTVFLDSKDIQWGDSLVERINRALQTSKYVVAVMTNNSVGKAWPQKEINSVLNQEISSGKKRLLPLVDGDPADIFASNFLASDKLYRVWTGDAPVHAKEIYSLLNQA